MSVDKRHRATFRGSHLTYQQALDLCEEVTHRVEVRLQGVDGVVREWFSSLEETGVTSVTADTWNECVRKAEATGVRRFGSGGTRWEYFRSEPEGELPDYDARVTASLSMWQKPASATIYVTGEDPLVVQGLWVALQGCEQPPFDSVPSRRDVILARWNRLSGPVKVVWGLAGATATGAAGTWLAHVFGWNS